MTYNVVTCDAHTSPLPVKRFDCEGDVWRTADGGPSLVVQHRVRLRCPWCRMTVTLRGRRLAILLGRRSTLTLRELAKVPTARVQAQDS